MIISIIVAAATNGAIGQAGQLPWHLPADLRFFKNTTWAMPVIMGRKTYASMNKLLPGRFNIVITRNADWQQEGVVTAASLEAALAIAAAAHFKEAYIIGGGEVYRQALPMAGQVLLTRVHTEPEDADTFFPALDTADWQLISDEAFPADDKHAYAFNFQRWQRQNPSV